MRGGMGMLLRGNGWMVGGTLVKYAVGGIGSGSSVLVRGGDLAGGLGVYRGGNDVVIDHLASLNVWSGELHRKKSVGN
jgi:hypothetical protein